MKEKIAIGLGTRNRPEMFKDAIQSLISLNIPDECECMLIICFNGTESESGEFISELTSELNFDVRVISEQNIGITFVRNSILEEALAQEASFLAFFDDDEQVDPDWLIKLFDALKDHNADIMQGSVKQRFLSEPSSSLVKKFFPGSFEANTGDELKEAYTNNVLFRLELLRKHKIRFNHQFALIGGSDSLFFSILKSNGAKIVFCKEAIVTETIPPSRANWEWILARYYRNGYVNFFINKERYGSANAYWKGIGYVFKSIRKCLKSGPGVPVSDKEVTLKKRCLRAKGMLHAMIGKSFEEYNVTHGE